MHIMNRLVAPKLHHHLRVGISLTGYNSSPLHGFHLCIGESAGLVRTLMQHRSHVACPSVDALLRMSANCLIQTHGISSSGVNVCGQSSWMKATWSKPSKTAVNFRIQKSDTVTVRNGYANENKTSDGIRPASQNQVAQNSTGSSVESWKLWQTMNQSVKDIGRRRGLAEIQVYGEICECVRQGKEIDWFELCQEAGFSPPIVIEINDAKAKAEAAMNEPLGQRPDEFGLVPVQCGPHITDVHVLLYNTMMACGITPQELFLTPVDAQPSQVPEEPPTSKKASLNFKAASESKRVVAADVPTPGNRLPNVKVMSNGKPPGAEDADTKKTPPKRLTQKHMLQWMADRNGVTLMELVREFQGYNECQLMRLILSMERKKLIQLSKGIFRVTASEEEQSM